MMAEWSQQDVLPYVLGLLTEEMGEANQIIGKAQRFGFQTPGRGNLTPKDTLPIELGDVLAAIEYAVQRGVVDREALLMARDRKLALLVSSESRDNLGRRLAP